MTVSLVQIRGEQIQPNVIRNEHLAEPIREENLQIDWARHTEILQDRKVVDYVQYMGLDAGGLSSVDITAQIGAATPRASSAGREEGVIVDAPKNRVVIRDAQTGLPILDDQDREVYGRLTYDDVTGAFMLSFFVKSDTDEEPVTLPDDTVIDFQVPRRFNLLDVDELFAANEKWVDGAADITAHLNIEQVAKDLYGTAFALNRNGEPILPTSVHDELVQARGGAQTLGERLDAMASEASSVADEVAAARGSMSTLGERLDVALEPDGKLKDRHKLHVHRQHVVQVSDAITEILLPSGETFPPADGNDVALEVFVNGSLQAIGIHYTEHPDGSGVVFNSPLQAGDIVILRWPKYDA